MIHMNGRVAKLTIEVHGEDESFWAEVPELPGCFASGDTLSELFSSLNEGIALYLDGRQSPRCSGETSGYLAFPLNLHGRP
jgi:predicted RNase H-like HicB family nuclease